MSEEKEADDYQNLEEVTDSYQELNLGSDEDESQFYDKYEEGDIDGEKENVMMSRQWYKRIEVDLWATKLHSATIGIRQQDQYRAASRQYTQNMEVIGDVSYFAYSAEDLAKPWKERGKERKVPEYKEIIAYNRAFWKEAGKDSIISDQAQKYSQDYDPKEWAEFLKRFVVKTFTELKREDKKKGVAGRWRGTLEESVIMSMSAIFGEESGRPRPFFYVTLPGFNYRIAIWRTHTFIGDRYVFTVPNPQTGELTTFRIKGRRFTPGKDFKVINAETRERVAIIDDRMLDIGGRVTIRLRPEPVFENLNRSTVFRMVLILFAVLVKFMRPISKKYKRIFKALRKKNKYLKELRRAEKKGYADKIEAVKQKYAKIQRECDMIKAVVVTNSELTLHYNPRRTRT